MMRLTREQRKTIIIGGAVVLVVVVGWLLQRASAPATEVPGGEASPAPSGQALPLSYSKAVNAYTNRRIQFDMYCQAIPSQTTFKNGTRVMLDNRSGDARNIKIGNDTYYLSGYGWRIVTLYSSTLPKTLSINCGSAVNVGTILLQR